MIKNYLFETVLEFTTWYRKEKKIPMSIESMLEEPFLSKLRILMEAENQARYECRKNANKQWREDNPELYAANTKLANEVFVNSDYFHSDEHIKSLSRGGTAASLVNMTKGNIGGKDSKMSIYKKALNRKKWAIALLPLMDKEFLPSEVYDFVTTKQWHNIMTKCNLVIKTDKKGGYHNNGNYYILNKKLVLEASNSNPIF